MSVRANPVQIITKRIVNPKYELVVDYPVVIGMVNLVVQQKMNEAILFMVNKLFVDQVYQLVFVQGYNEIPKMEVVGTYEIKTNEKGVLSLTLSNYTMAFPSAHGWTIMKSLTFEVETGRLSQLPDLFKPGSDYVKRLSDLIAIQIKQRDIPLISEFTGIKPNQDYYIADKVLVIYFQLVEITPYYYGFPEFPISVYQIQDIIRPDSPLYKML